MDGSQRNANNTLLYPHQEKPPPFVWKVWRECILATFLKESDVWRPTLHEPLKFITLERNEPWRERIRVGMKLEEALLFLPGYIKEAIGNLCCTRDNGKQISNEL